MKKYIVSAMMLLGVVIGSGFVTAPAYAVDPTQSAKNEACEAINTQVTGGGGCSSGAPLSNVIRSIINIISVIAGILAVIMIIISGMKFITSGGDAQSVAGAKKSLIYALVGLLVVALSQFLVRFVIQNAK